MKVYLNLRIDPIVKKILKGFAAESNNSMSKFMENLILNSNFDYLDKDVSKRLQELREFIRKS